MQTVLQDLRYGARMLWKAPGFTAIAILSLALGIGANTALFSLVEEVLLKTLPVKEPERLVLFEWLAGRNFRTNGMSGTMTPTGIPGTRGASIFRYDVLQKMQQTWAQQPDGPLSDLFLSAPLWDLTAVANEQAEEIYGQAVSGGYHKGLGVPFVLGRAINDADDNITAPPVVVLSHEYWQERFNASPAVIGQQLKLNKVQLTIVGVTGPGFTGALQVGRHPLVTVPLACEPLIQGDNTRLAQAGKADKPGYWYIHLMGRLKPGATREQARDSLSGTFQTAALAAMPPPRKDNESATLDPKEYPRLLAKDGSRGMLEIRRLYSTTIYGLFGVVALVLLIACANVANLLLARAALRGPEISVRLAVGAGRGRLIRQLLTESVLLAGLGGAVGVIIALWMQSGLVALAARGISFLPENVRPALNWRVLAFTVGVSLLTGVLFGLAPAWRATRLDLNTALKQGPRTTGAVSRLSKSLVVAQVAVSLLLLVGAGLFIRTLYNLQHVPLGFNAENLLLFSLSPGQGGYRDERLVQFYEQLFARLDALPGVRAASFGTVPLISQSMWNTDLLLPGETKKTAAEHTTNREVVRENYFATMEIPLLRGRVFTARDDARAPKVGIINQELARRFFPNDDALGKRVREVDNDASGKNEIEIIGIVADSKYNSQRDAIEPLLYTPWRQELASIGQMSFVLRTQGEPTALAAAVRQSVRAQDSNLPVTEVSSQTARAQESLGQERLYARLLGFFGGLALLLASIGLSGVLAYSVAQRTREIGMRRALGAQTGDVMRLVIWQGMKLVLMGIVAGGVLGYVLKRWLTSEQFNEQAWRRRFVEQLYGVQGADPLTFAVIALVLVLVALVACWIPARRATKVDPMIALKCE
ncbi:MAG: ABC transporter permease [Blastocatellia bacterium]